LLWISRSIASGIIILEPHVDYFDVENGWFYVAIVFASVAFFRLFQEMVSGIGDFGTAVVLDMFRSILTIPLQLLLVLVFRLGVTGMVYGLALASVLVLLLTLYILAVRPGIPDKRMLRGGVQIRVKDKAERISTSSWKKSPASSVVATASS